MQISGAGFILLAHRLSQCENERFVVVVVFIVNEVIEPAWRVHADECLFDAADSGQGVLEDADLATNGIRSPAFDRSGDDHLFLRWKETWLFAWDAECGADSVHITIQFRKCIALSGAFTT